MGYSTVRRISGDGVLLTRRPTAFDSHVDSLARQPIAMARVYESIEES